jgi:hypothetical protein
MPANEYANSSEPTLTNSSEVLQAIKRLKTCKAPSPNDIPKRLLRYLPKRVINFLTKIFNEALRKQYFPPAWEHARVESILKPRKHPTLPCSCTPISLLDTVDKLFEKILLSRVPREVNERGLLRDEQFGFRPKHSTTLQLASLLVWPTESVTRCG